jgi:hypothetical protein
MVLQYIKDMWSDAVPWIYAIGIVALMLIILGMAL